MKNKEEKVMLFKNKIERKEDSKGGDNYGKYGFLV